MSDLQALIDQRHVLRMLSGNYCCQRSLEDMHTYDACVETAYFLETDGERVAWLFERPLGPPYSYKCSHCKRTVSYR